MPRAVSHAAITAAAIAPITGTSDSANSSAAPTIATTTRPSPRAKPPSASRTNAAKPIGGRATPVRAAYTATASRSLNGSAMTPTTGTNSSTAAKPSASTATTHTTPCDQRASALGIQPAIQSTTGPAAASTPTTASVINASVTSAGAITQRHRPGWARKKRRPAATSPAPTAYAPGVTARAATAPR